MQKIAVIVGSLRRESINLKLAKAIAELGKDRFHFQFTDLSDLPIYNEDLWENPPASVLRLKKEIAESDGVLFVTPEYNRSLPAVVKNVLDWGSRPYGQSVWGKKKAGLIGSSPGSIGTAVSQSHFRSIATILDLRLMGQPEVYFVDKPELFDADAKIVDEKTRKFLEKYLNAFTAWMA